MFISESNLAALTSTSVSTTRNWAERKIYPSYVDSNGVRGFEMEELLAIPEVESMVHNNWEKEYNVVPVRDFTSVELFAGGGGLALGMEKAGFKHVLLNEFDKSACNTLRVNRPDWNVVEGDVRHVDFTPLRDKVDFLSGGFPCQAFSFAGKQGGFNDVRGTLFFELARAVKEISPKVFMGENVKGLASHDNGKTFHTICNVISELGYTLVPPRVLKAIMYQVPQKRERLILIAIRNDLVDKVHFEWPSPYERVLTLRDALFKSVIYDNDVPASEGAMYPEKKKKVLELVPAGGDWRDLPEDVAKEYMGGSWLLGGGKTGMARRLSLDEPSLTLTCAPAQKQTERCHPIETRPLSVREYARIQTFPDDWLFQGTISDRYKQIGNAVPVNLAWAVGRSIIRLLNDIDDLCPSETPDCTYAVHDIMHRQAGLIEIKDNTTQTSKVDVKYKQLNLFDLYNDFGDRSILENHCACEPDAQYGINSIMAGVDQALNKKVLIGIVGKSESKAYVDRTAKVYVTGQRFPSTVKINELFYFMPYVKGKGIRDIYIIKKVKVTSHESSSSGKIEYRMGFDIDLVGSCFNDYRMVDLNIWRTYKDTDLRSLIGL